MHVSVKNGFALTQTLNFTVNTYYIIFTISCLNDIMSFGELKQIREAELIRCIYSIFRLTQSSEFIKNSEIFRLCHYSLPHQHVQPVYV